MSVHIRPAQSLQRFLLALLCVALFALPAHAQIELPYDVNDPPEGVFEDNYYELFWGDFKIGHVHIAMTRVGDEILASFRQEISIMRGGNVMTQSSFTQSRETIDGQPLSFSAVSNVGNIDVHYDAVLEDGIWLLTTEQAGQEVHSEFSHHPGSIMHWGAHRLLHDLGYDPGTTIDSVVLDPQAAVSTLIETTGTIIGNEQIPGMDMEGLRTNASSLIVGQRITTSAWYGRDGTMMRMEMHYPGQAIVLVLADEETASTYQEYDSEFFEASFVSLGLDLPQSDRVVLRLAFTEPMHSPPDWPSFSNQTVLESDPGSVTVEVRRRAFDTTEATEVLDDKALQPYLDASTHINPNDPLIDRLARAAAEGATTTLDKAHRIHDFVFDYMSAGLGAGMATSTDVARNPKGDCTEYAVLTAAMARAQGIPARIAVGLVYMGVFADTDQFAYHWWPQFYIDGQWIDFDTTRPSFETRPLRVAFWVGPLDEATISEGAILTTSIMGNVELELVEAD